MTDLEMEMAKEECPDVEIRLATEAEVKQFDFMATGPSAQEVLDGSTVPEESGQSAVDKMAERDMLAMEVRKPQ